MGLVTVSFALVACGSSSAEPDGAVAPRVLTPDATNVAPLRVLALTDAQADFTQAMYSATLGTVEVTLARATPTELVLVVPAEATGELALSATLDGVPYPEVVMTVTPNTIADPATTVHDLLDAATADTEAYATTWAARPDLAPIFGAIVANLTRLRTEFDALEPAGQLAAAQFLVANASPPGKLSWGAMMTATVSHWKAIAWDIAEIAVGIGSLPAGGALSAGVAIAGAIGLAGDVRDIVNDYGSLTSEALEPAASDAGIDNSIVALQFANDVPGTFPLRIDMSNLSRDDLAAPSEQEAPVVAALQELDDAWPEIDGYMSPSLGAPPQLADVDPIVEPTSIDASSLHLGAVTGDVTLTASQIDTGSMTLTFHSGQCASGTTPVPFSFVVTYDDGTFTPVDATVPAELTCGPCGGMLQACCAGNLCDTWSFGDQLECGGTATALCCIPPGGILDCGFSGPAEFCCNGTATYNDTTTMCSCD